MAEQDTSLRTLQPGEIILDWIPRNWPLTPLGPYKNCYLGNWQEDGKTIHDIQEEINEGRCKAVGLLSGPSLDGRSGLLWVDIDGPSVYQKVEELSKQVYADALPPTLTICSGREGRERRLYSVSQEDCKQFVRNKYTWKTDIKGEKLEILWDNHQGVLMGLHPETDGFYTPQGLGFEWANNLPLVPRWLIDAIITKNARLGPPVKQITRVEGPGFGFSLIKDIERDLSVAVEALWTLPQDVADDYDTWIMVGQALHSVDESLFEHWDNWSQQSDKYQPGVCERKWESFRSENGIGLGTLIDLSNQYSNAMSQRLAAEAAMAPTDADLDWIEEVRQQEMVLMMGMVENQVAHEAEIQSVNQRMETLTQVVEELSGETIAEEGLSAADISELKSKNKKGKGGGRQGNPPNNIIRESLVARLQHNTVCDPTQETFYRYSVKTEGVWKPLNQFECSAMMQDALDGLDLPRGYGSSMVTSMIDMIGPRLAFDDWNTDHELLNFKNGVLDIRTMEMTSHDPHLYQVTQLPFDYVPYADCPRTKDWLMRTQYDNKELVKVLQAWLRAVLIGYHELQMFLEVVGAAGAGKAQPLSSNVLTPDGWVKMGDLKVGDEVVAADGKPATVLGVFPQGVKPIYRLTFDDESQCECCIDHLWTVQRGPKHPVEILSLGEIEELRAEEPHLPIWVQTSEPIAYKAKPVSMDPWEMGQRLVDSRDACVSDDWLHNSIAVRLDLLQGAMDKMGMVDALGRCVLRLQSAGIANDLLEVVRSLGGTGTVNPVLEGVTAEDQLLLSHQLLFQLPMNLTPFKRNHVLQERWQKLAHFSGHRVLRSVQYVGDKEAQCIYIDHPDHLYITDDYIVTHNTTFANLCIALVGVENTFSSRLNLLESNRFEVSGAYNKRLVVLNDADRYGGSVEVLKAMTGGDQLRMEFKYQKQSNCGFVYRGLVMATANEAIQTTDLTGGLYRRRLTVPFTRSRSVAQGDAPDRTMIAFDSKGNPYGYLAEELPGIVNWALSMSHEEMLEYTRNATDHVEFLRQHRSEMLSENNNILDWMNDRIIYDPAVATAVGDRRDIAGTENYYYRNGETWLYASYCDHCRKSNVREVGRRRFVSLLEDICKNQLKVPIRKFYGKSKRVMIKGLAIRRDQSAAYNEHPSIVDYAFNKKAYEGTYGSEDEVKAVVEKVEYVLSRTEPMMNSEVPELPW